MGRSMHLKTILYCSGTTGVSSAERPSHRREISQFQQLNCGNSLIRPHNISADGLGPYQGGCSGLRAAATSSALSAYFAFPLGVNCRGQQVIRAVSRKAELSVCIHQERHQKVP